MEIKDIEEGSYYTKDSLPNYLRLVEMIIDSPNRPGGKVVAWSTDAFYVKNNSKKNGRSHGKCGIATFAKWADKKMVEY